MRVESSDHHAETAQIRVIIKFDETDLQLTKTPHGTIVQLGGAKASGQPGGPALPNLTVRVAVPAGQWPAKLKVEDERVIVMTREPTLVVPMQHRQPAVSVRRGEVAICDTTGPERREGRGRDTFPPRYTARPFVPPDAHLYERAIKSPRPLARALDIEHIGLTNVALIELNPVRLTAQGHLELFSRFVLVVSYQPDKPLMDKAAAREILSRKTGRAIDLEHMRPRPEPTIQSQAQAKRLADIARISVINPHHVVDEWVRWPLVELPCDYLIITDDKEWDEARIKPVSQLGKMVALQTPFADAKADKNELVSMAPPGPPKPVPPPAPTIVEAFERLADWKRSRGLSARVITITDIVGGRYGDFKSGSRDLPEVIRKFLKHAHEKWGVSWLLLGGNPEIVPMRRAAGSFLAEVEVASEDPPQADRSFWTGSYLKMHIVQPGDEFPGLTAGSILVDNHNPTLIPYDAAGVSDAAHPGWYFTTDDSYATRSTKPTNYVRVNGPSWLSQAKLQWLYPMNLIPTDFYYASLQSFVVSWVAVEFDDNPFHSDTFVFPFASFPEHDWDFGNDGVYARYWDYDFDGVVNATDISVGRAPVSNGTEADTFVSKIIAYESFATPEGVVLNFFWPRSILFGSTNWYEDGIWPADPSGLGDNQFTHSAGTPRSVIKLKGVPTDFKRQLISEISDLDRRIIPYSESAGPNERGWHYAVSASDLSVNKWTLPFGSFPSFAMPSQWIVVYATTEELSPRNFLLGSTDQDPSLHDQEQLRVQMAADLPYFNDVNRLYEDEFDLTPAQAVAGPVQHLTSDRISAALNPGEGQGPHIVSLSGHGNPDGCCGGSIGMAQALRNGYQTFIVYADSCLTNRIDAKGGAFSQALLQNPSGGAVAYVGNTRESWVEVGDDFQRAFFQRLRTTGHLGLLNDSRCACLVADHYNYRRWIIYSLNLMGCPEMQVWRDPPMLLDPWPRGPIKLGPIDVEVIPAVPIGPAPGPAPLANILVHLRQGDRELTARTGTDGTVRFDLSNFDLGKIALTVSGEGVATKRMTAKISGPAWVQGIVIAVAHREDGEEAGTVRLMTTNGEHRYRVHADHADYAVIMDALEKSFIAREQISLMVDDLEGGTIERFRFSREGPPPPAG